MYAVIETGGKQYRVAVGDELEVERLTGAEDEAVAFQQVLLLAQDDGSVRVGTPYVPGARVLATRLGERLGEKVRGFKYKPKVNYRRRYGHRQIRTRLRIDAIEG